MRVRKEEQAQDDSTKPDDGEVWQNARGVLQGGGEAARPHYHGVNGGSGHVVDVRGALKSLRSPLKKSPVQHSQRDDKRLVFHVKNAECQGGLVERLSKDSKGTRKIRRGKRRRRSRGTVTKNPWQVSM